MAFHAKFESVPPKTLFLENIYHWQNQFSFDWCNSRISQVYKSAVIEQLFKFNFLFFSKKLFFLIDFESDLLEKFEQRKNEYVFSKNFFFQKFSHKLQPRSLDVTRSQESHIMSLNLRSSNNILFQIYAFFTFYIWYEYLK